MNRILIVLVTMFVLATGNAEAQSFSTEFDTVSMSVSGSEHLYNRINNLTTGNISISWKVLSNNFPTDWQANTGFCDNNLCYSGVTVFSGSIYSCTYPPGLGTFYMITDLSTTTTLGTYYANVEISTPLEAPIIETFIVTKATTSVRMIKVNSNVELYPNPVNNELNVLYNEADNVTVISLLDITGKVIKRFDANAIGNHTNIIIEMMPAGLYFIQLLNSNSEIIAVKKFVKQ